MKREIKFRAWVPKRKRMIFFWLFGTDEGYHIQEQEQLEECEIMQFTGLKDKNGKEIYEGDVLTNSNDHNFEVRFDYRGYRLYGKHGGYGSLLSFITISDEFDSGVEIIGNIHKNPELLNPKQ